MHNVKDLKDMVTIIDGVLYGESLGCKDIHRLYYTKKAMRHINMFRQHGRPMESYIDNEYVFNFMKYTLNHNVAKLEEYKSNEIFAGGLVYNFHSFKEHIEHILKGNKEKSERSWRNIISYVDFTSSIKFNIEKDYGDSLYFANNLVIENSCIDLDGFVGAKEYKNIVNIVKNIFKNSNISYKQHSTVTEYVLDLHENNIIDSSLTVTDSLDKSNSYLNIDKTVIKRTRLYTNTSRKMSITGGTYIVDSVISGMTHIVSSVIRGAYVKNCVINNKPIWNERKTIVGVNNEVTSDVSIPEYRGSASIRLNGVYAELVSFENNNLAIYNGKPIDNKVVKFISYDDLDDKGFNATGLNIDPTSSKLNKQFKNYLSYVIDKLHL